MPIPSKADVLPRYEQAKDQTAPILELTATTLDGPPGYEQLEIPPRFTPSEPTSTPSPQQTCINCQENICYHSGSVCENEGSPVKCAECKRREAEEMAECCMGILEEVGNPSIAQVKDTVSNSVALITASADNVTSIALEFHSVSTIDSPPAYEQAKIHSPRTTVNSPTATDAPPPYEDRRVFPGHLSFLPPIEVSSAKRCSRCTVIRVQPGTAEQDPSGTSIVRCENCQKDIDRRAEFCEELQMCMRHRGGRSMFRINL